MKTGHFCNHVNAKWMIYISDSSVNSVVLDLDTSDICAFCQKVMCQNGSVGQDMFTSVRCCKAALTQFHGNAIPECSFSVNAMLGKEKLELAEITIIAQRIVKDTVNILISVTSVFITKDRNSAARLTFIWRSSSVLRQVRDKLQRTV